MGLRRERTRVILTALLALPANSRFSVPLLRFPDLVPLADVCFHLATSRFVGLLVEVQLAAAGGVDFGFERAGFFQLFLFLLPEVRS